MAPALKAEEQLLLRLTKTIDLLRHLDKEVPSQVVVSFFFIASHNGCRVQDLMDQLHLESSSASRITDWLSDYHRLGKPGMGLINKKRDNMDLRVRRLYLTLKGQAIIDRILEIFSSPVYRSTKPLFTDEEFQQWLTQSEPGGKLWTTVFRPAIPGATETEQSQPESTPDTSPD